MLAAAKLLLVANVVLAAQKGDGDVSPPPPPPPAPPDDVDGAKAAFARGTLHYRQGAYDEAIEAYREGYRLSSNPGFIFNIAQAERLSGRCADALDSYRRYLELAPETPYREEASQRTAEMEACVAARASAAAPVLAASPPARLSQPHEAPGSPAPAAAAHPSRLARPLELALVSTGVAALGVSLYFLNEARLATDRIEGAHGTPGVVWSDADREAERAGQRGDRVALIAGGASAVCLISAALLVAFRDRSTPSVALAPRPSGVAIAARISF